VISPLLANVYLHYVFDLWAHRWRRQEATGDMIIVRYADDIVVGFEHEADARRFWDAMRKLLEEFSLSLHPEKTRLIEFGRYAADRRAQRGLGKPETFKFLGFIFISTRARPGRPRRIGSAGASCRNRRRPRTSGESGLALRCLSYR
jgi:RNA-directed DNA polymerase